MDRAKLFTYLSILLLLVCLALCLTSVIVLRNAVAEGQAWQKKAELLAEELDACIDVLNPIIETETSPNEENEPPTTDADILCQRFLVRESNGKIGVYSEDGYLVRIIDCNVDMLPKREREALKNGITIDSWSELVEYLQNYE